MAVVDTQTVLDDCHYHTLEVETAEEITIRDVFSTGSRGSNSILHVVQMSRIFSDSKTFVDMKLKHSPGRIVRQFDALVAAGKAACKDHLAQFVNDNFTLEDQMEEHTPADWTESPRLLSRVADARLNAFVSELNARWKMLCRRIASDVQRSPERYSLIFLPHPVIIPGGRFREVYYWDSYWIIRGLLLSEMFATVKGMLLNFVHLIREFGFVPNGGRTYYLCRSQPPLFILMVDEYVNATGDTDFITENMPFMVTEFEYWVKHHFVTVTKGDQEYRLARYNCEEHGPRPESYFEDRELVEAQDISPEEKQHMYLELKSAAESGWDFSTRWMINGNSSKKTLKDTKTRFIVPVDLNSFIVANARRLAKYFDQVMDDASSAAAYTRFADDLCAAMDAVLWNEKDGVWYDFDLLHQEPRAEFFPSNLTPLWTESARAEQSERAVAYLGDVMTREDPFPGGVPTSLNDSGEQWDFPNCWPPLEHMLVMGLEKTGLERAKELAFGIAKSRINGALVNFASRGHMFEKYNAVCLDKIGGGGEYDVQLGFGWSNGVVLDLIDFYHERLASDNQQQVEQSREEQVDIQPEIIEQGVLLPVEVSAT